MEKKTNTTNTNLEFHCLRPAGVVGQQGAFKTERLWVCSRELLRQPLMKSLMRNSELSSLACSAFTYILVGNMMVTLDWIDKPIWLLQSWYCYRYLGYCYWPVMSGEETCLCAGKPWGCHYIVYFVTTRICTCKHFSIVDQELKVLCKITTVSNYITNIELNRIDETH